MAIMSAQLIFSLSLVFLVSGAHMATISITNNCPYTVWPGTLANAEHPQLAETGFELATRGTKTLNIPAKWAGRFWARTQCSGSFTCATADCGSGQVACNGKGAVPPASLVEIKFQSDDGQDYYNLSLVDGFNLPVAVAPENGSGSKCVKATCSANVNAACPAELQVKGTDGSVIACKSACEQFKDPKYCCTEAYADNCPPTNYATIFKNQCPQAYSYPKDDASSVFACTSGANYAITFCP
ncbi:thaumatin-like protein 1b [Pistacia vera]|uniref:thaumatin-like protein 1b n=1 Tax=Pistacia vera TaxID=55513 RepID=UPI001262DCC3|nr:thaumatin-like protein 1b [Pistacia vera]